MGLTFGVHNINLHAQGNVFVTKAFSPTPGSADICFITNLPIQVAFDTILSNGIDVIEGIVIRTGAIGPIRSIYFRDPDGNLIELSSY